MFFRCLSHQSNSLRRLTYAVHGIKSSPREISLPPECQGLSTMSNLQHVTLDGHCPFFKRALSTEQTCPPNLVSLTLEGLYFREVVDVSIVSEAENFWNELDWMTRATSIIKNLREVYIHTTRSGYLVFADYKNEMKEIDRRFKARKICMQVYEKERAGYHPPFLYGEETERRNIIFCSDYGWHISREEIYSDFEYTDEEIEEDDTEHNSNDSNEEEGRD